MLEARHGKLVGDPQTLYPWMQLQTHSWAELGCSLSFGLLKQRSLFKGGHVLVGKKTASDPLASRLQYLKLPASCPVGLPEGRVLLHAEGWKNDAWPP